MTEPVRSGRSPREVVKFSESTVYLPSEDTSTLARALRSYDGKTCLEIGFGSGAILQSLVPRFEMVVGTDLLSVSDAVAAKDGAEVVLADRATCFREDIFDVVAFNPPYLPSEGIEDRTVDGGAGGLAVPLAFLDEALRVAKKEGVVVLLLSNEADLGRFRRLCEERGLRLREVEGTDLFYERLIVFEVRRGGTS